MSPRLRQLATVSTLLAILALPGAMAQAPAHPDEMRAVQATPQEIREGQALAQTQCAGCHGLDGLGVPKGVPHIAGQRAGYLLLELRNYKSGARGGTPMSAVVNFLSDDAAVKAAAYYASLDPAQPAPGAKVAAPKADVVALGKASAAACAGCHGEAGVSAMAGTPSLAGLYPAYIADAMKAYKAGKRKSDVMAPMASVLGDADLANVALYYALQKPVRAPSPAKGDKAAGKEAAAACAGCHGAEGVSTVPSTPSLAGQDGTYLSAALAAYKGGARSDETMKGIASSLDEVAMGNLAAYYASLAPHAPDVRKPLAAAEWAERCDRCHGMNGNSTDPSIPAIAGQREDYLRTVLDAYRTGKRKSSAMAAMSGVLSDADVGALAAYYSRQKPRAVVFVVVPAR
jgi:cytochrome c553